MVEALDDTVMSMNADSLDDLLQRAETSDPREFRALADAFSAKLHKLIFYDDVPHDDQEFVHYTSWERALAILGGSDGPVLRMYNYERSNDPQEGSLWRRTFERLKNETAWLDEYLPEHEKTLRDPGRSTGSAFGCSFSSDVSGVEDNLTFWRLYGNDGEGCSFKMTGRLIKGGNKRIYKVRYLNDDGSNADSDDEHEDKRVACQLESLIRRSRDVAASAKDQKRMDVAIAIATGIRKVLGGYHHLAKSKYFEDEREWRMIEVDPSEGSIGYDVKNDKVVSRYIPGLDLRKVLATTSSITIGPQVPNAGAARAYVEHLVRGMGMEGTDVNLSKRHYRSGR